MILTYLLPRRRNQAVRKSVARARPQQGNLQFRLPLHLSGIRGDILLQWTGNSTRIKQGCATPHKYHKILETAGFLSSWRINRRLYPRNKAANDVTNSVQQARIGRGTQKTGDPFGSCTFPCNRTSLNRCFAGATSGGIGRKHLPCVTPQ
jgi:hypothetical protein